MPELPEVETIRRGLDKFIKFQKIERVKILCDKSFIGPKEVIENQRIISIGRKGKALLINLENGITMLIHLRMTGQLIYRSNVATEQNGISIAKAKTIHGAKTEAEPQKDDGCKTSKSVDKSKQEKTKTQPDLKTIKLLTENSFAGGHPTDSFFSELPNKQTRVIFELENGNLYFNDQRKFGFVKILETDEVENDKFIRSLAKEPWDMTVVEFKENLMRHKSLPIKAAILDQKVIAGIGNIYADEALFYAKIHPKTRVEKLTDEEIVKLLEGARSVMQASIDSGGSTMATYVKPDGTKGDYLRLFAKVFRREGEPCVNCGTEVVKIRVAGRGTHICPHCQQEKV